jgi:hypothetical protein
MQPGTGHAFPVQRTESLAGKAPANDQNITSLPPIKKLTTTTIDKRVPLKHPYSPLKLQISALLTTSNEGLRHSITWSNSRAKTLKLSCKTVLWMLTY